MEQADGRSNAVERRCHIVELVYMNTRILTFLVSGVLVVIGEKISSESEEVGVVVE